MDPHHRHGHGQALTAGGRQGSQPPPPQQAAIAGLDTATHSLEASHDMTVPSSRALSPSPTTTRIPAASIASLTSTPPPRLPASPGRSCPSVSTTDMSGEPAMDLQSRLSVVLLPSPSNAHEYAESRARADNLTPAPQQGVRRLPGISSGRGRGRPRGWRPGMSYASMRGNAPPDSATKAGRPARPRPPPGSLSVKRRGRPPKVPSPPPMDVFRLLTPAYLPFLCEWSGCKAELQNLETLRRHMLVVHVKAQNTNHGCSWGKCGGLEPHGSFYKDRAALESHVEEAHIVPMSWHIGDGPCNSFSWAAALQDGNGSDVPDFLKDADGNQVTPSTRFQEVEDVMTYKLNRQKLKDLILAREANLPSDGESEASGPEAHT